MNKEYLNICFFLPEIQKWFVFFPSELNIETDWNA